MAVFSPLLQKSEGFEQTTATKGEAYQGRQTRTSFFTDERPVFADQRLIFTHFISLWPCGLFQKRLKYQCILINSSVGKGLDGMQAHPFYIRCFLVYTAGIDLKVFVDWFRDRYGN